MASEVWIGAALMAIAAVVVFACYGAGLLFR